MRAHQLAILAALAVAACRVDDTHYVFPDGHGGDDAGVDAMDDAGPGLAIVVAPGMASVIEGDESTVAVKLSEAPAGPITVMIDAATGLSYNRSSMDFTPADWSATKLLVIQAEHDDDAVSQTRTVILHATGLAEVPLPVTVTDDDQLAIFAAPDSVNLTEGDTTTTQIKLTAQPETATTVSLASTMPGVATVTPSQLTFTTSPSGPGSWNTLQTITITAVQNAAIGNGSARVDADATGMGTTSVDVVVTDDDSLQIDPSTAHLDVTEGQSTGALLVGLTAAPPGALTVQLSSDDPAVTVSPSMMTFTSATPQPVTVTAPEDANADGEAAVITLHPVTGPATDRTVTVQVTDNDQQGITLSAANLSVPEGMQRTFTVQLAAQPAGPVSVDLTALGGAVSALPATVDFTTATWATPVTITVTALDDADLLAGSDTVRATATGLPARDVMIAIPDDDTQVIDASIAAGDQLAVGEGGQVTFTMRLRFAPSGSQVVTIGAGPNITRAPPSYTFTATDYTTPRTVTVFGLDNATLGDVFSTITLSGAGAPDRLVQVRIVDNDNQDILVTPTGTLNLTEGMTGAVTVALGANPGASTVTVTIASDDPAVATPQQTTVALTSGNWQAGVSVPVSAPVDADAAPGSTTLHFTAPALAERTLPVAVTDPDVVGIDVMEASPILIAEGATGLAHVRLTRNPGPAGATVNVSTTLGLTTQTSSVTFTGSNWNQYRDVDLRPERDDDLTRDSYTVTFRLGVSTISAVRMVQENPDTTILIGFDDTGSTGVLHNVAGLEAWGYAPVLGQGALPVMLPRCLEITKVFAVPTAMSSMTMMHPGLYAGSGSGSSAITSSMVYDPGALNASTQGTPLNDGPRCMPTGGVFIAVSTSIGLNLQTKQLAVNYPVRCGRIFTAGALPDPFMPAGPCMLDQTPVRLWFIAYPSSTCGCPA